MRRAPRPPADSKGVADGTGGEDQEARPLSGVVSALEAQASDPERLNLYLDGRFAFGLTARVAADAGLTTGASLTPDDVAGLVRHEAAERAMQQALVLLSYRPRSEQEIRLALGQKGHALETVEAVVARLQGYHYLDDEAFALSWVENRQRLRPQGARRLRAELRQKGVGREVVDQAISDAARDERALALQAAEKKAAGVAAGDYAEFGRKVGGFLMRRGFAPDVVWDVVRRLWAMRTGETAPPQD